MKCPHCKVAVHPAMGTTDIGVVGSDEFDHFYWTVLTQECPECNDAIIFLKMTEINKRNSAKRVERLFYLVHPKKQATRDPAPPEVPGHIAEDFNEACVVLADSAKASAALSRRCLQHVLADTKLSTEKNLNDQIEEVLAKKLLPSHIADDLDAVRVVGNFAAHPQKSKSTGEVLPVEPQEAEWNLDVLEALFDFLYVQPARAKAKREALNKKLEDAGKPPLKALPQIAAVPDQGEGDS